ncbi:1-deoxy-D-xylulose-5-phosphate reductoisomerase [Gordonia sp. Z-3]|uniref:1-deoxy-D-xylulose-5-phosphate reductoisomerase n=1 Tax=unclassified Gordonia (in: high G+C Gram-positive bacteria) TaxID=2657482 RepID=UPI000C5C3AF6|nr:MULTISPECIES: 1-deoxy-D-xylulose-5-phosphate reductoisomerase [unclassified Gordonia (in: high G+C Gram-positive bacteria)]MAU82138.1 1-deoxy-D-xylulose-5-phosphate reductoisomerase [Gordonia sp. (in: high G+C Gram-positive bacteria)]MED5802592.1 1-deoxy-D-xylulose-5-phosphate reductoisomerase [Gordonia sp. Z-3]
MTTRVLILGSTGSIGVQALEVIAEHPERFQVVGLGAGGGNLDLLREQARAFGVSADRLAVADPAAARSLSDDLGSTVLGGAEAMCDLIASVDSDVVLNAVVGSIGLRPSLAALRTGARLALANKESLVAGGSLVLDAAAPGQIVPVDSEHSAIAQCLRGGTAAEVDRLVLTASGGPFFGWTREALLDVTPEQAGHHPTWSMGPMITLNSATLVNKALEVIEAHLLFGVDYDRIDVTVHRQSIVHSMVTFVDGATIAKASPPSMKLPIALALGWPDRVPGSSSACDFSTASAWTFEPVDNAVFPAIDLARAAGQGGGSLTAVYNAANEAAAAGFFAGAIRFPRIVEIIGEVLGEADQWRAQPGTVEDVLAADQWARAQASRLVTAYSDGVNQ